MNALNRVKLSIFSQAQFFICFTLCIFFAFLTGTFLSGCSQESNSPDLENIKENSHIKFAPENGYRFQQLFESDDLMNYKQVEVGIGSLDFIDTSLVHSNTKIEDIPIEDLKIGIINASLKVGSGSGAIELMGFAQLDAIDTKANTITVSGYGPTIKDALVQDRLTLEVGQEFLSRGEALFSDVEVGDTVAIDISLPQENDPLFGYMWATDSNGQVKLIDHPESYVFPEDPFIPSNNTTIQKEDLAVFDDAHRIYVVDVSEVDPELYKDGILDTFPLDGPQQIILYGYAHVDFVTNKTAMFSSLGSNIEKATGFSSLELLLPTSSDHLFYGEATLSQIKPGDTVLLQLVLSFGKNNPSSGNIWLVNELKRG